MSVSSYEKDGKTFWKVYVNIRNGSIREQKMVQGFESEKAALAEEKKIVREITEKLMKRASQGYTWGAVINAWEASVTGPNATQELQPNTIANRMSRLSRWTLSWLKRPAAILTNGDAREVFNQMESAGRTLAHRKHMKSTINVIFKWGIENKMILGVHESPVNGLKLQGTKGESVPDILTIEEIKTLLLEAKRLDHPWYPVWAMALLTGMRNGELHALLWTDVDLDNRKITVSKSYDTRAKKVKCTKNGRWRIVPISDQLLTLLLELKVRTPDRTEVLPRFWQWDKGGQATVLRTFCSGIGIRSIRFHALRACFATQLLAHDIAPARVMKICGWTELKTMQHYVRLAGVDERDATQVLRVLPDDASAMREAVDLFDLKAKNV